MAFITIRNENVEDDDNLQNYSFELFAYPKRKGFGSELLKEMQDKRQFLILHVKKTSTDAIKCYKKNGFQINGENQNNPKHRMVWRNKNYN
ncbi:MAG: GNAT family N-acetyltransferase [Candidatus Lokiarchaeota archaeon]|nr:GNAT family N-acetyltransferase [Candidatus Lokiarchaeota archaeon]